MGTAPPTLRFRLRLRYAGQDGGQAVFSQLFAFAFKLTPAQFFFVVWKFAVG
jgi:hypothetical protein